MALRLLLATTLTLSSLLPAQTPSNETQPAQDQPAASQQLWLPRATGRVTVDTSWTVLRPAELAAETRPTDPKLEPAHTLLLATLAELRAHGKPEEHLLFQRATAAGQLAIVNAYSDEIVVTVADVLDDEAVQQMQTRLLGNFGAGAKPTGHQRTELFSTGGLVMHFERQRDAMTWRHDVYLVPADQHLQYFETICTNGDATAQPAIEAMLRSFDGAKEGSTLSGMLMGGAGGAVLGIFAANWFRRRRQRATAAAGRAALSSD